MLRFIEKLLVTRHRDEAGFTLVEIMVVVIIIGLLASLVGPRLFRNVEKAKQKTTLEQIRHFSVALDLYRLDIGSYPNTLEELVSGSGQDWSGPYIKKIPPDPWGNPYSYDVINAGEDFRITSSGGGKTPISSED